MFLKISQYSHKHLCRSPFLMKSQDSSLQRYWKTDSGTGIFLLVLQSFREHLFCRASANWCLCSHQLKTLLCRFNKICKRTPAAMSLLLKVNSKILLQIIFCEFWYILWSNCSGGTLVNNCFKLNLPSFLVQNLN